jgi:hypothetical protein
MTHVFRIDAPGTLQLQRRCEVYNRQYIKCIIYASIKARAIQNGYVAKFQFDEIHQS